MIYNDTGKIYLYTDSGTRIDFDFIPKKQWTHVALTRSTGLFKMFVNGQMATSTYTDTQDYSNPIRYIGESPNSESQTWFMDASISNFRFTKGTSLYNATFIPSAEPLTAHANTKILCLSCKLLNPVCIHDYGISFYVVADTTLLVDTVVLLTYACTMLICYESCW